jgi:hypothetical protein
MIFLYGICIAWILICGRVWWSMSPKHPLQRRLVALGAGLGAALFFYVGTHVLQLYERHQAAQQQQAQPNADSVRMTLKRKPTP